MKKKVKTLIALSLVLPFHCSSIQAAECRDTGSAEPIKVFTPKMFSRPLIRIPSIIKTNSGRLIAFAEARAGGGDSGKKDIVEAYSDDGGLNWTLNGIVAINGKSSASNPVPVYDAEKDVIFLSVTKYSGPEWEANPLGVSIYKSEDNGISWEERRIFEDIHQDYKQMLAGPGHGLQMTHPSFKGRLVIPYWTHDLAEGLGPAFLYSDDHGASWKLGAQLKGDVRTQWKPNETIAAELKNGSVLLISRALSGPGGATRTKAISSDVSKDMGPLTYSLGFSGPTVEGAILRKDNRLIFSSPLAPGLREDLGVRISYDEGDTWTFPYQLTTGSAAYSDLVMVNDSTLGILYETAKSTEIVFRTACLSAIENSIRPLKDKSGSDAVSMVVGYGAASVQLGSMDGQRKSVVMTGKHYVSVAKKPQVLLGTSDFTVNLWFRKGEQWNEKNQESLFSFGSAGIGDQQSLRIYPSGSLRYMQRQASSGNPDFGFNFGARLADGKWHMVTVARADQKVMMYVDGVMVASNPTAFKSGAPIDSANGDFGYIFGARPDHSKIGYGELFNGEMGEIRVYRRAVSDVDVKNMYRHAAVANDALVLHLDYKD